MMWAARCAAGHTPLTCCSGCMTAARRRRAPEQILYRMYGITKDPTHLAFAKLFDKPFFRIPMVRARAQAS